MGLIISNPEALVASFYFVVVYALLVSVYCLWLIRKKGPLLEASTADLKDEGSDWDEELELLDETQEITACSEKETHAY